jgi:hypothetical protein
LDEVDRLVTDSIFQANRCNINFHTSYICVFAAPYIVGQKISKLNACIFNNKASAGTVKKSVFGAEKKMENLSEVKERCHDK